MVVLSQPTLDVLSLIKTCKSTTTNSNDIIPIINMKHPDAKTHVVKACEKYGFFKLVNHGVPMDFMARIEEETLKFFQLPQSEKDRGGPPDPFGYGNKRIGPNGDVGWVEYLMFSASPDFTSHKFFSIFKDNPQIFRGVVNDYVSEMKRVASEVLEMIGDEMKLEPKNVLSKMLNDEESDTSFRLNHYPPCPDMLETCLSGRNLVGFGEHTDPQIISVLRSNNASGLQISLRDGTWVSVPPDHNSLFIIVGDSLQVMSNGRFKSVRHRVLAESKESRVSMIYFGGPPLKEKIKPIPTIMEQGEESLYKEFTWGEYKKSAYKSRLADYRLGLFEKTAATH